jgi:flagellar biosynthetic protein FlhB
MNPATGIGRMFSARGVIELCKGLAKVGVVGAIAFVLLKGLTPQLLGLSAEPLGNAIGHAAALAGYALLVLTCGLALIAAVDVPFQLWQHGKDLRMTREEVKGIQGGEGSARTRSHIREATRAGRAACYRMPRPMWCCQPDALRG